MVMPKSKLVNEGSLTGVVQAITFADGFFRILVVRVVRSSFTWSLPEITVSGPIGEVLEGELYQFTGHLVIKPRFGQQFAARRAKKIG